MPPPTSTALTRANGSSITMPNWREYGVRRGGLSLGEDTARLER